MALAIQASQVHARRVDASADPAIGGTAGVGVAASVPDSIVWTIVVVMVGVFFTIVVAPVSYSAMLFWMSIALVPLFATEGRYLDLIWNKTIAALIGGCVAAAVALSVVPIRLSRDLRSAVLQYWEALDTALESQRPGKELTRAAAGAALDRAHCAVDGIIGSAFAKADLFPQPASRLTEQGIRVDAVHEAFLALTPTLTESSRRLHGWTDQQVGASISRLRDDVDAAKRTVRAARPRVLVGPSAPPEVGATSWLVETLHTRLAELA